MIKNPRILFSALTLGLGLAAPLARAASPTPPAGAVADVRMRKIVINLKTPDGGPPPEGTIEIASLDISHVGGDVLHGIGTEHPVHEGRAELVLPAPNKLSIRSSAFPRHAIKPQEIDVPAGANPLVTDLEVSPAGSVHVRLTRPDGQALSGWGLTFLDHSDVRERRRRRTQGSPTPALLDRRTDEEGRIVVTSLPLDSDFQLVANQGSVMAPSPILHLGADSPVRPVEWSIPEPELFSARLVDPDGSPIPDLQIQLTYRIKGTRAGRDGEPVNFDRGLSPAFSVTTDARGHFSLPLNFEAPGDYELKLEPRKTWQPTVIAVDRAAPRSGQTFTISPGHILSGRLLDAATRQPVPNVHLLAMPDAAAYFSPNPPGELPHTAFAEAQTDAEGRFRFSNLPPGHFRLTGSGGVAEPAVVTVPAASEAPIELLLKQN